MLWVFSDTLLMWPNEDGETFLPTTAGWASPKRPTELTETLDSVGAPLQFVPFTPDEQAYNDEHWIGGDPNRSRIVLWPTEPLRDGNRYGWFYYHKLIVHPGWLDYEFLGVGLCSVEQDAPLADRLPGLIFDAAEPKFFESPLIVDESDGQYVYVYGDTSIYGDTSRDPTLARVPLEQITERAAYRFWDGSGWSDDIWAAQPVAHAGFLGRALGSVHWNSHLQQYLSVSKSTFYTSVQFRTAPRPEGPWSEPVTAFTVDYQGSTTYWHTGLGDGRNVYVSYYDSPGRIYLVKVRLQ
jgi:hypothetical protein